jgi:hypothetical protein
MEAGWRILYFVCMRHPTPNSPTGPETLIPASFARTPGAVQQVVGAALRHIEPNGYSYRLER